MVDDVTMADQSILNLVRDYLRAINQAGIRASRAILFGSWARGEARSDSDIDVVIIAPEFDGHRDRKLVNRLWELTASIPGAWRIEPIACGERQWQEDGTSPIIEIARREGEVIAFTPEAV
jgi:predicted nucleotidyltransferase